jgi:hypothetical protein
VRRHVRALFAITALGSLFTVAGTAQAAECPNEAIRIAQGATRLPDCRAYERVSPAESTGGVVGVDTKNRPMFGAIRADGNAAAFGSSSAVGEAERSVALGTSNLARRTESGWSSFTVLTTTEPSVLMDGSMQPNSPMPSSDMSRMMFKTSRSLGPPNPIAVGGSIYISAPAGKGPPTWLSRRSFESTQPVSPGGNSFPLGGSPDLSSGYFRYGAPLTDLAGDNLRTNLYGLYFFEGSTVYPAGVLPSGMVSPQGALPAGTGRTNTSNGSLTVVPEMARNQVSTNGSKLFFVSPAEGAAKQLYVQEGASPGRLISHDMVGNPAAAGLNGLGGNPGTPETRDFAYATPDGSRVIFRSESALTGDAPESGVKTYRAEITPSAITLTYLPEVDGYPWKIDEDASTILFETAGSVPNTRSFYAWDEDRPATPYAVATDLPKAGFEGAGEPMLEPVFSEDGSLLVFASMAEVEPGVPAGLLTQIYRWTKQSGTATCISCRRDGGTPGKFGAHLSNSAAVTTDNPAYPNGSNPDPSNQSTVVNNRKISSDGSRVFFDTSDPLDPARDVNNARDVYMWENGKNYLLTSGRNSSPSLILDSSVSGDSVMLVTKDGLIPSDTNQTNDVYSVRVDGGFVEPVSETCEGDACQGRGSGARQASAPGSGMLAWAGSKKEPRKSKARSRQALATTQLGRPGPNSARVRIQVPSAGKVSIAGADVKSKARRVKKRGAVVIAVGLSPQGKSKLAHKGQLKTTVRVTFRPKSGAVIRKAVKLSYAGPKGGRR